MENKNKYIGLVKWFHDNVKNANYGFIQQSKLGDHFFHEKSIEANQSIESFKENEVVTFISQPSSKHLGKLEAVHVKTAFSESDYEFLFSYYLESLNEVDNNDFEIIIKVVHQKIDNFFNECTDSKLSRVLFELLKKQLNEKLRSPANKDINEIIKLLEVGKSHFKDTYTELSTLIEAKISGQVAFDFWLDSFIENCPVDYVATVILNSNEDSRKIIFGRCTEQDKSNIFFRIFFEIEQNGTPIDAELIKNILRMTKLYAENQYDKVLTYALNICPVHIKLSLWIEGLHENLDFDLFKLYTIILPPEDQRKFVKKVLRYISEGKANISVADLTSLNVIDFETAKLLEDNGHLSLDYSTSIILNVISELHNQIDISTKQKTREAKHRIYDLILKQIRDPKDILEIKGYFDECEGRCSVSVDIEKDENGEETIKKFSYNRNEYKKPRLHVICDGRKAVNKMDKTPVLSEENGMEFWWCANQKCYKPSRQLHSSEEWEKYSLMDFLSILKISYEVSDLEIYLSLINKTNRFLDHMKCRKCNYIIRPIKQTNYAFYGINEFHCTNESCEETGKRIYLSHCLNGNCEQVIDSRDCVKCKPAAYEVDQCGWYVCKFCLACCSDEGIKRRMFILEKTGQVYKCHTNGHRELGEIACDQCGSTMNPNESHQDEYNRVMKWFINNKDNQDFIARSGQNKKGKWWFRFKKGNLSHDDFYKKLETLIRLGFRIPDFERYEKNIQLVAECDKLVESGSNVLICSNSECGKVIDLSNDPERSWAIKKYHKVFLLKFK